MRRGWCQARQTVATATPQAPPKACTGRVGKCRTPPACFQTHGYAKNTHHCKVGEGMPGKVREELTSTREATLPFPPPHAPKVVLATALDQSGQTALTVCNRDARSSQTAVLCPELQPAARRPHQPSTRRDGSEGKHKPHETPCVREWGYSHVAQRWERMVDCSSSSGKLMWWQVRGIGGGGEANAVGLFWHGAGILRPSLSRCCALARAGKLV